MLITPPNTDEYGEWYQGYVARAAKSSVIHTLVRQPSTLKKLLRGQSDASASTRPAPEEWSIKEVVGHINDGERVFGYRLLRFSRGDASALASFDENAFVENAYFNHIKLRDLLDEFAALRSANLTMIRALTADQLDRHGIASNNSVSVRALVYIISGHVDHHLESLKKVYLKK